MEEFSKVDIFDTKGMEYLFTIAYLIILVVFWKIASFQIKRKKEKQKAIQFENRNVLNIPKGLYYNKNHTWAHLEKSGVAKVGIDDFLLHVTGDVNLNIFKNTGEIIQKGELLTELIQEGKKLQVYFPISGKITKKNDYLLNQPDVVNEDPYRKGWLYKIEPENWKAETDSYYFSDEAIKWSENELVRFKDFLVSSYNKENEEELVMLQDGGELKEHILQEMPEQVWSSFQEEFLNAE